MKRKDIINIILFILVFAFAAYRYSTRTYSSERSAFVMDTIVDIKIVTNNKDANEILDYAFKLMEDYENKFSFYNNKSQIWKFNNSIIDGMKINLGSLAKGYIVDKVVEYLKQQNVISGFVNAGGDMRIFGRGKPFKIGIQHPRSESNEIIDVINVGNMSVVTSGDYERYFMKDGKRYHHIINPLTGYPSQNAISVTVISETALIADAYSTALFLLEPEQSLKLAEETDELEAVVYFIKDDKIEKLETKGFKKYH